MKKLLWSFLFLIVFILLGVVFLYSATPKSVDLVTKNKARQKACTFTEWQLDSIEREYPNLVLIPKFREVILTAISYYPDLKDIAIRFQYSKERTTMACRPDYMGLLKGKRVYNIFINNQTDFQGILLEDVPIEAQVGVIGHEIAHAVEYESRSTMGILQLATMYLTKEGKKTFERATDLRTIGRGLGWQLREWAQYSMFDSPKATEEYKTFKRAIYMSPKEIEDVIQNYQIYDERPTSTVVMSAQ